MVVPFMEAVIINMTVCLEGEVCAPQKKLPKGKQSKNHESILDACQQLASLGMASNTSCHNGKQEESEDH